MEKEESQNRRKGLTAREAAVRMLLSVYRDGKFSKEAMEPVLPKMEDKKERALATRLLEGCLERELTLCYIIDRFSKLPVKKMKPCIACILQVTVYQLKYMDKIPASAACNEAVNLAKKFGFVGLSSFVNGVARAIARAEEIKFPDEKKDAVFALSIRYSMPETIVELLKNQYGDEKAESILKSFLTEKKGLSLRTMIHSILVEQLKTTYTEAGFSVTDGMYDKNALLVTGVDAPERLPLFSEGGFYIQDESSMQAVLAAGLSGNEKVLDLCAAPGGKSCMAADLLAFHGTGTVDARDCSETKCRLIQENVTRLKLPNVTITVSDATKEKVEDRLAFDVVFADTPCTGLGILQKKPDIKHFYAEREEKELLLLQKKILRNAARAVKENGILIFSTCTLNKEENMGGYEFLIRECNMVPESLNPYLSEKLWSDTTKQGYLQMLPDEHGTDGFFVARMRKAGK